MLYFSPVSLIKIFTSKSHYSMELNDNDSTFSANNRVDIAIKHRSSVTKTETWQKHCCKGILFRYTGCNTNCSTGHVWFMGLILFMFRNKVYHHSEALKIMNSYRKIHNLFRQLFRRYYYAMFQFIFSLFLYFFGKF